MLSVLSSGGFLRPANAKDSLIFQTALRPLYDFFQKIDEMRPAWNLTLKVTDIQPLSLW